MKEIFHIIAADLPKIQPGGLPKTLPNDTNADIIRNILFAIIGALALVIIVVQGLRYITSAGDEQKARNARNGIIYAFVGLAIALTADAIVAYVVKKAG